jgi:RNA polymerase sigma-70 factor (ECF subfamily)
MATRETAITVTGFVFPLQSAAVSGYHTARHYPSDPPPAAMDDARLVSTLDLVERFKSGDRAALDQLCARLLPSLRRWASGRLPRWSRDLMDTDDLVQETVIRALNRIGQFEVRHVGSLQAYLRQAIVNRVRDEVRRAVHTPAAVELDENQRDAGTSPLEQAIGKEAVERYEAALDRLKPEEREAIVGRIEMEWSYQEVADALGKPSADAARMAVNRALLRLAEEMALG